MNSNKIRDEIKKLDPEAFVRIHEQLFNECRLLSSRPILYHYTSLKSFVDGIIVEKPVFGKEICLWASRYTHLNDPTEIISGIDKVRSFAPDYVVDMLQQMLTKNHVLSFSTANDSLGMWKMYGDDCSGIMLGFDTKVLQSRFGGLLQPCMYINSEYEKDVTQKLKNCDFDSVFKSLSHTQQLFILASLSLMYVTILKNNYYESEKEVRCIGIGSPYLHGDADCLYRTARGKIVPYVKVFLPKSALKSVWLGPRIKSKQSVSDMKEMLLNRGFNDVQVLSSSIPYQE